MDFQFRHINRKIYPQKHLLVVEDVITNQRRILEHLEKIFDPEGIVQISVVSGAIAASTIIGSGLKIDLILLDHDLPEGNGSDLLNWLKKNNYSIPVITFSGIAYNNQHMFNLGAQYIQNKGAVIDGGADDLIKGLLSDKPSIAELYCNKLCWNYFSHRWWAHPQILVGGSVLNKEDYQHLKNDYKIQSVINVETEHSDLNKEIENLFEAQVPDNGTSFSKEIVLNVVKFAHEALKKGNIYLHCQMGSSRSPAFAYAVLRYSFKLSQQDALKQIALLRPDANEYGHHPYHKSYIKSIEDALSEELNIGIAEYYINTVSPNQPKLPRYWLTPKILIGGNTVSKEDMDHLKNDYNINSIINLDQRQNHIGEIDNLLELFVPDNGDCFPEDYIHQTIKFAKMNLDKPMYIHCHLGFSRSPHFAYIILRTYYKLTKEQALNKIKDILPSPNHQWGFNQHTNNYITSIEKALLTYKE